MMRLARVSRVAAAARRVHTARVTLASDPAKVEQKLQEITKSSDPKDSQDGYGVTGRVPDNHEQATGLERLELLELAKGNTDPFGLEGIKWGPAGTKAEPREIPSHFDSRLVGCCCDPESELVKYFYVKGGDAQACPCGQQYFKLVKTEDKVSW
ncbi:hypothetical protein PTSG_10486 [Salpingoeca rosetta]|uniref:Cytochrome c oxidase polypeptide Vb n=1 Tax=Salpingoeca rosetta (strain ATCC 50818 / BSB-021) TaxID=946362 RepID=F2UPT3_SALR5|nr:uncharacterized protein PTSG_10486 [Salpingoeca rosetta]EGD79638.1 hypothetical protein PTSG_10486 [Salpingoeca rosetta]|eukprot:XP_004988866.1 hypothetical protein PTSG_10486 [Salpingoeca rosetta]